MRGDFFDRLDDFWRHGQRHIVMRDVREVQLLLVLVLMVFVFGRRDARAQDELGELGRLVILEQMELLCLVCH